MTLEASPLCRKSSAKLRRSSESRQAETYAPQGNPDGTPNSSSGNEACVVSSRRHRVWQVQGVNEVVCGVCGCEAVVEPSPVIGDDVESVTRGSCCKTTDQSVIGIPKSGPT